MKQTLDYIVYWRPSGQAYATDGNSIIPPCLKHDGSLETMRLEDLLETLYDFELELQADAGPALDRPKGLVIRLVQEA